MSRLPWWRWASCFLGLLILLSALASPASTLAQETPPDPRFGLIEPHDAPDQADALGVGWGRARFHWAMIQPDGPVQWIDAELTNEQLARELASGREVVGLLIGLPGWAADSDGLPQGLYLPYDDPENVWAEFVRQVVTRYQGRIDHWIIWNEPDVWDSSHPGYTWPGDEGDYVQLLRVAYLTAKEANPDSVIHLAAVSHWWDVSYGRELYFKRLLDTLVAQPDAAANDYFYDVATLHLYFDPVSIYDIVDLYVSIQHEAGIDKPFWLVETNAAPSTDPSWPVPEPTFNVSLFEQAAYIPQALSLALAAGVERVGIYKLIDTPGDYAANPEPFGLVRADLSPRPAFTTTQVALEQLADAQTVTWLDRGMVAQVVVEKPDEVLRLLWSRLPYAQAVQVPALFDRAVLTDMWGNESPITPEAGVYSLTLPGAECNQTTGDFCMIGGPPLYLAEAVPAGASLRLEDAGLNAIIMESPDDPGGYWQVEDGGISNPIWRAVLVVAVCGAALCVAAVYYNHRRIHHQAASGG
jgi:hypothetical protein